MSKENTNNNELIAEFMVALDLMTKNLTSASPHNAGTGGGNRRDQDIELDIDLPIKTKDGLDLLEKRLSESHFKNDVVNNLFSLLQI